MVVGAVLLTPRGDVRATEQACAPPPPLLCQGRPGQLPWSHLSPGLGTSSPEPPGFGPHFVYTLLVRLSSDVA